MQICTICAYQLSLFVGLLTVTDPDLELARRGGEGGRGFVLLALVAFHPFAMYNSRKYPFLPLWKFQLSFVHFFKCFGLTEPSTPRKFQSLLSGVYGYFLELHNFFYIQNKEAAPEPLC